MPPASAPSPSGARRTPCWARRWGENVQWGIKAWSGNRRRRDLPMRCVILVFGHVREYLFKFKHMQQTEKWHKRRYAPVVVFNYLAISFCRWYKYVYKWGNLTWMVHSLNQALPEISWWLKVNGLSLNVNKTHYMLFTKKRKCKPCTSISFDG